MPVTSLKLTEDLKRRIQRLVEGTPQSAHAFMAEAIERAAEREELRRRFGAEAAEAEHETAQSGQAYDAAEVFDCLEERARGTSVRRPEPRPWRRSG